MLAITDAYRAGLLRVNNWLPNLVAGLIVGIVALPLAMAFAIASGVPPQSGIYTAIIAGVIVAIFGGSRVQIAGPTGAFVVILAHITARYGIDGLQIATLLAGIILIAMGLSKLGGVIKFIPDPVIVGFTSGIGVIIFVGEWKDFFGLKVQIPLSAHFHTKLLALVQSLPTLHWTTTALAALSLFLIFLTPRVLKRIPGPLVAMVVATALEAIYHFDGVATIGTAFGSIPQTLPQFSLPTISVGRAMSLIGPAFTIALLGAIESLLSATAADAMSGTRHDANQELIGQGLANIVTPLFGGFAATGAIARTATNIRNGGNCALAAIVHSLFLLLVIVFLAPLAIFVPLCALAAILFVVAYNMSDLPHFTYMLKHAPRGDKLVLLATFLLTIFTDLVVAVNVGVILAMLLFVRRMSQLVEIEQQNMETLKHELALGQLVIPANTIVYKIQGPFFFGAAEKAERSFAITHSDPKNIIFRLKDVPFMDMTGLETFYEIVSQFRKRGVNVFLCEANTRVTHKLTTMGISELASQHRVYESLEKVLLDIPHE